MEKLEEAACSCFSPSRDEICSYLSCIGVDRADFLSYHHPHQPGQWWGQHFSSVYVLVTDLLETAQLNGSAVSLHRDTDKSLLITVLWRRWLIGSKKVMVHSRFSFQHVDTCPYQNVFKCSPISLCKTEYTTLNKEGSSAIIPSTTRYL